MADPECPVVPAREPVRGLLAAAVAILTVCAFLPALWNGFVLWDDDINFLDNARYRGLSPAHLKWMFTHCDGVYIPLSWVTLGADYLLWGMNPLGYHLTNVVLHAVNAVLFYFLILMFLRLGKRSAPWVEAGAAAVGALLFSVHPLRAESVAWVTERRDVLSGLFFLLTLLAYLRMAGEEQAGGRARRWLVLSICCFALSLLSKAAGLTLPLLLLVLDVYPLRRHRAGGVARLVAEKIPYAALAAGFAFVAYLAQEQGGALRSSAEYGLARQVTQPGWRICFYVWKTILPIDLSPVYLYRPEHSPFEARFILSGLAAAALTVLCVAQARRRPFLFAAWTCFILLLLPALGLVQVGPHFAADRYTYLACMPWAILAASALGRIERPRGAMVSRGVAAAVLGVLGTLTCVQTRVWRDSMSLWNHALRVDSANHLAYNNRGGAKHQAGDLAGARSDVEAALRLNPRFAPAYRNRAVLRRQAGDAAGALADYAEAIRLNPQPVSLAARGRMRVEAGDLKGAREDFDAALRLRPDDVRTLLDRGAVRRRSGDARGAIADCDQAAALEPHQANAFYSRALAREAMRDREGAMEDYDATIRLDRSFADAWLNRGALHFEAGRLDAAEADFDEAIRVRPGSADGWFNLGMVHKRQGRMDRAVADLTRAVTLRPDDVDLLAERGKLWMVRREPARAIADFERALRAAPSEWASRAGIERLMNEARRALEEERRREP